MSPLPSLAPLSESLQGVASCSAAACHGNGIAGSKGGEATTWAFSDPHAQAYQTLRSKRSQLIEKNLHPDRPNAQAVDDELCLNCHVKPNILRETRSARFHFADGVGCESCHGPSQNWLEQHYQASWQQLHPAEKEAMGFRPTRDLVGRARVCIECHVGVGDIEVNHDLVAAGHPRLRFEFAAYLANYPKHWSESSERQRHPNLDASAWAVGQAVSAEAALRLLAHRASSPRAPWPEFADYDCQACHHDLATPGWRQQAFAGKARLGALPINDWYFAALPVVDDRFDLGPLAASMSARNPDNKAISEQATKLADTLKKKPFGRPGPQALLTRLAAQAGVGRPSWERDTQFYLGAAALSADGPDKERRAVDGLRSLLDNPRHYNPAGLRRQWQTIREQLPATRAN